MPAIVPLIAAPTREVVTLRRERVERSTAPVSGLRVYCDGGNSTSTTRAVSLTVSETQYCAPVTAKSVSARAHAEPSEPPVWKKGADRLGSTRVAQKRRRSFSSCTLPCGAAAPSRPTAAMLLHRIAKRRGEIYGRLRAGGLARAAGCAVAVAPHRRQHVGGAPRVVL